jgi:hypothetical protein
MSGDEPHAAIAVRKFRNQDEADEVRCQVLETFLLAAVEAFRQQTSLQHQVNAGVNEFEAYVDAQLSGGDHPAHTAWLRRRKGTPAADAGTLRARRLIVLMAVALARCGLSQGGARRMAAKEATIRGVFPGEPVSAKAVEHWHYSQGALTPEDEQLVATALASAGVENRQRVALYFVGLAHLVHNPSAVIVPLDNE